MFTKKLSRTDRDPRNSRKFSPSKVSRHAVVMVPWWSDSVVHGIILIYNCVCTTPSLQDVITHTNRHSLLDMIEIWHCMIVVQLSNVMQSGWTAIGIAFETGHMEVFKLLQQHGAVMDNTCLVRHIRLVLIPRVVLQLTTQFKASHHRFINRSGYMYTQAIIFPI